jgi:hypothetical protein
MHRFVAHLVIILAIVSAVGCASTGKQFNYQRWSELELGKTTEAGARALLGTPMNTSTLSNEDGTYSVLLFQYIKANVVTGVASRVLIAEFKDGVLNSFAYNSGFPEDSTDFDIEASQGVRVGKSTVDDVERIVGRPTGKARCPSMLEDYKTRCDKGSTVWLWAYTSKTKGLDVGSIRSKVFFVVFDDSGVAAHVEESRGNL